MEAALAGAAGCVMAVSVGLVLEAAGLAGVAVLTGAVGAANGVIGGWTGIYEWRSGAGRLAFLLDSTWALVGTFTGLVIQAFNRFVPGREYVGELSRRRNRHVYARGVALRGGFALSMGNVISNAGGRVGLRGESALVARRRQFVTAHEELHIWQNRLFGPAFQVLYVTWTVIGAVTGALLWPFVGGGLGRAIETVAYYDNPFEYWAYRNDDYWPPKDIHPKLGWKRRGR